MMVPGHCICEPRHRGNAGFMVAILLTGLNYYYDVTGDPRSRTSIIHGAHYLLDESYSDEVHGFRYTSCPNMQYSPGRVAADGRGDRAGLSLDARRALPPTRSTDGLPRGAGGSGYGKGFSHVLPHGPAAAGRPRRGGNPAR